MTALSSGASCVSLILSSVRSFLFPERCVICGELSGSVCTNCIRLLERAKKNGEQRTLPNGDTAEFIYDYKNENVQRLLFSLKNRYIFTVYEFALKELEELFSKYTDEGYSLCHIPRSLHNRRKFGVDQAQTLVRMYLRRKRKEKKADGGSEKYVGYLGRRPFSGIQKNLAFGQRMKNAEKAFYAKGRVPEKILLFDDIVTSGATACAAAKILADAGAKDIRYVFIASSQ